MTWLTGQWAFGEIDVWSIEVWIINGATEYKGFFAFKLKRVSSTFNLVT